MSPPGTAEAGAAESSAAAADRQFVTFELAGETFAVPMAPVQEIIRVPQVARMPLAPPALDGLANLRGRVLPIVSLRRLFGLAPLDHDDATRALVINLGQALGFVVDRVASVVSVEAGEIQPASAIQSIVKADFLTGVIQRASASGAPQPQLMLVLDFARLVAEQLGAAAAARGAGPAAGGTEPAAGQTVGEAAADELRLVSFTVESQEYAIAIEHVQEIVQVPAGITAVPHTSSHVLGLISLRQRLLPLVSLRGLFGMPDIALGEQHRIVVVAFADGSQVGLVTDSVKEVLGVPRQQAEAMPAVLARSHDLQAFESICRLDGGKRLVSIIAADQLLGLSAIREAVDLAARPADTGPEEDPMHSDPTQTRSAVDIPTEEDAQVVIFRLGDSEFAVPIMSVQEIVRVPDTLTRVPRTPRFVEGVINLRGTVLPVIDQRTRLGLDAVPRNDGQRIMVYTLGGLRTGFIVDSVAEVLRIPRSHLEAAPVLSEEQARLITQLAKLDGGRRLVMMIDPGQLLGTQEAGALARLSEKAQAAQPAAAPLAKAA